MGTLRTAVSRSLVAGAALVALIALGLCPCPDTGTPAETCHDGGADLRMTAGCCCGEAPVLKAFAGAGDTRRHAGPVAPLAASAAASGADPHELLTRLQRPAATAAHSPPSLLQPPLRN